MAFSISTTQTVLWDQIQYSGNPSEFAWVLPVQRGAVIEESRDEWFAALDAATQPVINGPATYVSTAPGCALAGCGAGGSAGESNAGGGGPVQVLAQGVVGPYETVTLQSSSPSALTDWLTAHSFDIPATIAPILRDYVAGGFDFIAVRLRPECGVGAMKPVRIVTPGADPTLPLRMVAAGAGAEVDLVLWVLGEGRWDAQNFPAVVLDESQLTWDQAQGISNYEALAESLMAEQGGRSWLTEFAAPITSYGSSQTANPSLYQAYYGFCSATGPSNGSRVVAPAPCDPADGSANAADSSSAPSDGSSEASEENADASEAGVEVSETGAPGAAASPCQAFDDIDVATKGIDPLNTWLTRMRAHLPVQALGQDLVLAAAQQTPVSNVHQAGPSSEPPPNDPSGCTSTGRRRDACGSATLLVLVCGAMAALLRRRPTKNGQGASADRARLRARR
jgi:hypothetical protein